MKTLILTEKPSVARDFAHALGVAGNGSMGFLENESYVITWAVGHLLTPFDPEDYDPLLKKWTLASLPILPAAFKFKPQPQTKKQLEVIKKLLKRPDLKSLIVATDAGREGELIARLILQEAKSKLAAFRFWTSAALSRDVIASELRRLKPLEEYDRLFVAGRARQRADWLVGMNLSRLATLKLNDLFSVGRVQTAVLSLLVERRKAIETFVPRDYFELKAKFLFKEGEVLAYWYDPGKKEEERRKDTREFFDSLAANLLQKKASILRLEEAEKVLSPPGLFSLTELQRQANIRYGFSATKTLELAQTLYEKHKCLSYPRTDSKVMAASSFELVKNLVFKFKALYPEHYEKFSASKVSVKNKVVFDDARLSDHHGLIPLKDFKGSADSPEGKIFHLVLKRFISNFLENHRYLETELEIECEKNFFKTRGKKILEMGFKILEGQETELILPSVKEGAEGFFAQGEVEAKKTKPPSEYTEASLLYDMTNPARLVEESNLKKIFRGEVGLGTQATRAQIIETLLKRSYIERGGKNLKATDKGVLLVEYLNDLPSTKELTSVSQTAKLELSLQSMAQGESDDREFLNQVERFIHKAVEEWKNVATVKSQGEREKTARGGKRVRSAGVSAALKQGKCPLCQAEVRDFPKSFSCSRWKEGCAFTIWKTVAEKKLTATHIKDLMAMKKTGLIKGFKSKAGKSFDAHLKMNAQGKVEFEFQSH